MVDYAKRVLTAGKTADTLSAMTPPEETPEQATLRSALRYRTQDELAEALHVTTRTLRRWMVGETSPPYDLGEKIERVLSNDQRPAKPDFTFIDLFAGIGGIRRGFEQLNGRCVFTSEWDAHAVRTYQANYGDSEKPWGDITTKAPADVPSHDLLLAGFPCQPFSLAGVSKKNSLGRAHGFLDKTQGTLFFNIVEILRAKQPKAFLLENVKNLRSHDGGRTFEVITGALAELGYHVVTRVVDATPWVPQKRERVYLVGFKQPVSFDFDLLERPATPPTLGDVLHRADETPESPYTLVQRGKTVVDPKYTLSDHLWRYLQDYAAKHRAKGNGFGCSVFGAGDVTRTLSARYHKDGSEILIAQRGKNPRRLTPRECARLMGFDRTREERMVIPVSDTQAYRQFGNSVAVPVVSAIAQLMVPRLLNPGAYPVVAKAKTQIELEILAA
jgi:DNA (cytosine-5)-methyltransferase 1